MTKNYYVTTSIPYVNGEPHLGHALEFVQADVLARSARQKGLNVIYSTGSDEHGTKVLEKAQEAGKQPQEFADELSQTFRDILGLLNISNDRFVRTTDKAHEQRAQIIWKNMAKDIYKGTYTGLYDVTQEEFVSESHADPERLDPNHPKAYRKLEEENYFFRLSAYTAKIKDAVVSEKLKVIPKSRRNEILAVLEEGLEDISISRPTEKLSWGVPVPGDPKQVMYVWFEALMNYITVLGYPEHDDFKNFWPANVQVIGKDILRFHAAVWPAMLLSLGLPMQQKLYVHGFINVDGQKMSKSVGNVVSPKEIIDSYGVDAFRYFFLRHISSSDDGDFTWVKFEQAYNNELANELGNAVSRLASMITKYQSGVIGNIPPPEHDQKGYQDAIENCRFDVALDDIWDQIKGLNQYIEETKPWVIAKEGDEDHLTEVLAAAAGNLLQIAELLTPFMPATAERITHMFSEGFLRASEDTLFPKQYLHTKQPERS